MVTCDQQEFVYLLQPRCSSKEPNKSPLKTHMAAGHLSYICSLSISSCTRQTQTQKDRVQNMPVPHLRSCQSRLLVRLGLLMQMFNISEWKQLPPTHKSNKCDHTELDVGRKTRFPLHPLSLTHLRPLSYHEFRHKLFLFPSGCSSHVGYLLQKSPTYFSSPTFSPSLRNTGAKTRQLLLQPPHLMPLGLNKSRNSLRPSTSSSCLFIPGTSKPPAQDPF